MVELSTNFVQFEIFTIVRHGPWYCHDCLRETFYPASGILSHTVQSFTIWARNYANRMESLIARETFPRSSDLDFQNCTNVRL